jgi:hypothetical protein
VGHDGKRSENIVEENNISELLTMVQILTFAALLTGCFFLLLLWECESEDLLVTNVHHGQVHLLQSLTFSISGYLKL